MGGNSSKHAAYPFPIPTHNSTSGHGHSQSVWSFVGKGKGKKGKQPPNVQNYYVPGGYSYVPQPFLYYPTQNFSNSYYPRAGQMNMPQPAAQAQPNMQMPVPSSANAPQQGQSYDPVIPPTLTVPMPAPPQAASGVPPPPQMHYEPFEQQPQQSQQQAQQQYEQHMMEQDQQDQQEEMSPQQQQQHQHQHHQHQQQQQPPPIIPPSRNDYRDHDGPPSAGVYGPPGPRPRTPLSNPLPTPPRDLYEMSPYRSLLRDLPATTQLLERHYSTGHGPPQQYDMQQSQRQGGGGFGNLLGPKKKGKGLFRSSSNAGRNDMPSLSTSGMFGGPLQRSNTHASYLAAPPLSASSSASAALLGGMPMPHVAEPDPNRPPPVRFDHMSPLSGFMNHSPHRVLYQNNTYPSALHLLEALKFLGHRPDLADRIRAVRDVQDVYPLSASMQEFVRSDWGQVFLQTVEEVLYMKFKQHPDLRSQLMNTGTADIIYSETEDAYWGEGPFGQGANELGKSIMRVRERLRREGYNVGPPSNGQP